MGCSKYGTRSNAEGWQGKVARRTFVGGAMVWCVLCLVPAQRSAGAYSRASRGAGSVVFQEKGCVHCHGENGAGTDRGPDLRMVGKRCKKPQIEKQIRDGGSGMPAFGAILQPDEVKSLVDFLAAKKKTGKNWVE